MKPLDPDIESLLRQWIEKAEADLEAAERLAPSVASRRPPLSFSPKTLPAVESQPPRYAT